MSVIVTNLAFNDTDLVNTSETMYFNSFRNTIGKRFISL